MFFFGLKTRQPNFSAYSAPLRETSFFSRPLPAVARDHRDRRVKDFSVSWVFKQRKSFPLRALRSLRETSFSSRPLPFDRLRVARAHRVRRGRLWVFLQFRNTKSQPLCVLCDLCVRHLFPHARSLRSPEPSPVECNTKIIPRGRQGSQSKPSRYFFGFKNNHLRFSALSASLCEISLLPFCLTDGRKPEHTHRRSVRSSHFLRHCLISTNSPHHSFGSLQR
jgi:hypothetical protein